MQRRTAAMSPARTAANHSGLLHPEPVVTSALNEASSCISLFLLIIYYSMCGERVAAVTGAGSGMGRGLALELAMRGCHLALCDVDMPALEDTAAEVRTATAGRVTLLRVDVRDEDEVRRWREQIEAEHGRLDLLFNNAGIGAAGPFLDMPKAAWDRVRVCEPTLPACAPRPRRVAGV